MYYLLLGARAFVVKWRLPQATPPPVGWDFEFAIPTRSAKEAPLCFAGQRRRRSSDDGLGERAEKKVSEDVNVRVSKAVS
jgi:hypothetical protein